MTEPNSPESSNTQQPSFHNSITQLQNLSSSLTSFLNFYTNSISPSKPLDITSLPLPNSQTTQEEEPFNYLETLCKQMSCQELKRHVISHISDLKRLRKELPEALKLAPNAPNLVLNCFGKFFSQGKNAYTKDSRLITSRAASLFILECFLLMGCGDMEIGDVDRENAESWALGWKKRLEREGGLKDANEVDARGVLMLVAGFGVFKRFTCEDVRDLVVAAGRREFLGVLMKSGAFMEKIAEVVQSLRKSKRKVDAVDLVYTFGLEDKFDPQTILISYLHESLEKSENTSHGSTESDMKQLEALKSVRRCLQRHKVDPAELLPLWEIAEMISTLEKNVSTSSRISEEKPNKKRTLEKSVSTTLEKSVSTSSRKSEEKPNRKRKEKESQTSNKSNTKIPRHSYFTNQRKSPHQWEPWS